jgi:enoyl-[acyl-carrier-protein] reductase (NADH)
MTCDEQEELSGRVALIAMAEEALARALERVLESRGARVIRIDTSEADWHELAGAVQDPVDILVHYPVSAVTGDSGLDGLLHDLAAVRPIWRGMVERGSGRVIHLTSLAAERDPETGAAALLSNRVVTSETQAMALADSASGVTFNCIALGAIEGLDGGAPPSRVAEVERQTPLRRAGTLEEVAEAVVFLASPGAGFITGVTLPVCGGLGLGLFPVPSERSAPRP